MVTCSWLCCWCCCLFTFYCSVFTVCLGCWFSLYCYLVVEFGLFVGSLFWVVCFCFLRLGLLFMVGLLCWVFGWFACFVCCVLLLLVNWFRWWPVGCCLVMLAIDSLFWLRILLVLCCVCWFTGGLCLCGFFVLVIVDYLTWLLFWF